MSQDSDEAPADIYIPKDRRKETGQCSSVVVEKSHKYNYNLDDAPKNKKLILLTVGEVAILGPLFGDKRDEFILGWFPLPSRDKEAEAQVRARKPYNG